ncbi:NAD-P-binding protein [Desarmillaria tabescens]|uniref:NAD-P-binding protein n=1 Tax=Armillaria tabescens TaxID=1929756 RepID=A0AA39NR58_ARMTA|nr:NAD-P-binding protein [Desarmillaria tabescens]KAK0470104.1 NAD-P-binding protein [Desarmillaria tabescens]
MGGVPSKTFNPVEDLPSLSGKVVVVTGSSKGIGFAILQHFARMGAKVYMAARDETRAKEAIERLDKEGRESGLGEVIWHQLDLKDPHSAKESAERFIAREKRLDILVNNAAMIASLGKVQENADGIVESMAVNYLGPYVFTRSLLQLLESTTSLDGADVRIINVGSGGHSLVSYLEYGSKEAWNHQFKWSLVPSFERYKYSKLAMHLWTNDLARRLSEEKSKVMVLITQPGAILSDGTIQSLKGLPYPPFWIWLAGLLMHPQTTGAYTSVFAACAPRDNPEISQGAYIYPPNIAIAQAPAALDEDRQRKLVDFTEEFLKSIGV